VTSVKINVIDGNAELLKPHPWTLLEAIYSLLEMTNFILPKQHNPEVAPYTPPHEGLHIKKCS